MVLFIKAKPYPDGTVRSHGKGKYRKMDGGWIPVKEGMTASERAEAEKQGAGKGKIRKIRKINGTKEYYKILDTVANSSTPIYMDDVAGKSKSIYNALTKEGLLTWTHVAHDEYKCELTEAGKKSYESGNAYFRKTKREQEQSAPESFSSFEDLIAAVEKNRNK